MDLVAKMRFESAPIRRLGREGQEELTDLVVQELFGGFEQRSGNVTGPQLREQRIACAGVSSPSETPDRFVPDLAAFVSKGVGEDVSHVAAVQVRAGQTEHGPIANPRVVIPGKPEKHRLPAFVLKTTQRDGHPAPDSGGGALGNSRE